MEIPLLMSLPALVVLTISDMLQGMQYYWTALSHRNRKKREITSIFKLYGLESHNNDSHGPLSF